MNFFMKIRMWFNLNCNTHYFKLLKAAFNGFPFDYGFLYTIEYYKLKEMLSYFKQSKYLEKEYKERILQTLTLAIKLLDIIINQDRFFKFNGGVKLIPNKNGTSHKIDFSNLKYTCLVKVNLRNGKRFMKPSIYELHKHELYIEKAKFLYHKVRYQYEYLWAD